MDCSCVRYTDLPHTSNLFADFTYHPDRVRAFYPHIDRRFRIHCPGNALPARAARGPGGSPAATELATVPQLEQLAREGTVAVVTGQQVGLFSGPAYTIYKALTAVKLARSLAERGIPAVPVFWLATEDHDFAEVNHCWVFDAEHHPIKLEKPHSPATSQPVGQFVLSAPPVAELRAALAGLPFGDEISALVEETYQPGRTMGEAFSALLKRLLAQYGLLHVDPMSPAMRELAAPAIRSALAAAPDLTAAVLERNRALEAAGYHAQVHVEDQTSFVFLLENGRRYTLRRYGRDYLQNGRRFSTEELMDRAGSAFAQRAAASGSAGFHAADGGLHRRSGRAGLSGAIRSHLPRHPGPHARRAAPRRFHAARSAQPQTDDALRIVAGAIARTATRPSATASPRD